jgi:hypothetical protein
MIFSRFIFLFLILELFIVYDYLLFIFLLFGFWDLFGENRKNRVKRGDFDMVLEEDLDMDLEENEPVLIGGI